MHGPVCPDVYRKYKANKSNPILEPSDDLNKGDHVARPTSETVDLPVIFSLQHVQSGKFCCSILDHKQKGDFADALYRRKNFTWNDLYHNNHKKLGVEPLPVGRIKATKPAFMTEDVDKYEVIRFFKRRWACCRVQEKQRVLYLMDRLQVQTLRSLTIEPYAPLILSR